MVRVSWAGLFWALGMRCLDFFSVTTLSFVAVILLKLRSGSYVYVSERVGLLIMTTGSFCAVVGGIFGVRERGREREKDAEEQKGRGRGDNL